MSRLKSLADRASKPFFILSLCLVSVLYGIASAQYNLFPNPQIQQATTAAADLLREARTEGASNVLASLTKPSPVVRNPSGKDDGALILVSGGPGQLEEYNPDGGCVAWLMDRKGEIKHIWKYNPTLWADLERLRQANGAAIGPYGLHLLEDGGLLVSFQDNRVWPYGLGIVRLDKDSNIIWRQACHAHHWFTVTPDQKIITPSSRVLETPQRIGDTRGRITGLGGRLVEDRITVMSMDGEILEQMSMLDAVDNSGLIGLYHSALGDSHWVVQSGNVQTDDPLHFNSVQEVGQEVASAHDWLNADDLLVSFRNINTIAILDRATARIKWSVTGVTVRQHSPRFRDSDNIIVFDNLGGSESLGGSRLAQINLETRRAETIFPTEACQSEAPQHLCSLMSGYLDLNRSKDAVLMTAPEESRVIEIDLNTHKVLWEYSWPGRRWFLHTAEYCYNVSFEMNQTKKSK